MKRLSDLGLISRIVIDQSDHNSYTVRATSQQGLVANTKLTVDEALWSVAEFFCKGSSRFLMPPICLVRQEVRFRGLIEAFGDAQ